MKEKDKERNGGARTALLNGHSSVIGTTATVNGSPLPKEGEVSSEYDSPIRQV